MSNTSKSFEDYFRSNIINGSNFELTVLLEKISTLSILILQAEDNQKNILACIINDYADIASDFLHTTEDRHLANVHQMEVDNG